MKRVAFSLVFLSISISICAQEFYTVNNPNQVRTEGKPRPEAQVKREKELALSCLEAVGDYVKTNGIDKTVQEINKGRLGAFRNKFPKSHFYLSLSKKRRPNGWPIIAHGSNSALIGFEVGDVSTLIDFTGWQYLTDLLSKADRSKIGVIADLLWADPQWANGKKCRMTAYNRFLTSGVDEYWVYFAVWLDA
jgi:hypothetical protein